MDIRPKKRQKVVKSSLHQQIYRARGALVSPPLIGALICFSYEVEKDWLIWPLGLAIFLLGFILRFWARQHSRYHLKVPTQLTTTGPYAFVRNPVYIGNILICLGCTIVSEFLWFVPIALLWCMGLYYLVVRYEEKRLLRDYGEAYSAYCAAVPRWFPRCIQFWKLECINRYFWATFSAEIPCFMLLLPYIMKEIVSPWFE